jgi:hypothetical protein
MREIFEQYLTRPRKNEDFALDQGINNKLSLVAQLKSIETRDTKTKLEELKRLYTNDPRLKGANDSAVMKFIKEKKKEIYHDIDASREMAHFKEDLREK